MVWKDVDPNGAVAWKLVRQSNNTDTQVVSKCEQDVKFPWLCDKFWNPPIEVAQLTWDAAHEHALDQVKAGLRYAEAVKALSTTQKSTNKLQRAATNVKNAIARVKEIEAKANKFGHVFDHKDVSKKDTKTQVKTDMVRSARVKIDATEKSVGQIGNQAAKKAIQEIKGQPAAAAVPPLYGSSISPEHSEDSYSSTSSISEASTRAKGKAEKSKERGRKQKRRTAQKAKKAELGEKKEEAKEHKAKTRKVK